MSLPPPSPDPDNLSDLASATIQKAQKAQAIQGRRNASDLQIHIRDMSLDSTSSTDSQNFPSSVTGDPVLSPRLNSRFIPPPTPPPRSALPPTPQSAPQSAANSDSSSPPPDPAQLHGLGFDGVDAAAVGLSHLSTASRSGSVRSRQQQLFFAKTQKNESQGRIISLSFPSPETVDSPASAFQTETCSEASTPLTDQHSPSPRKSSFEKAKLREEAKTKFASQERALENLKRLSRSFSEASPPVSPTVSNKDELSDSSAPKPAKIGSKGQEQASNSHPHELRNKLSSESQSLSRIAESPNEAQSSKEDDSDDDHKRSASSALPTETRPSSETRAIEFLNMSSKLSRSIQPRSPTLPDSASERTHSDSNSQSKSVSRAVRAMADSPQLSRPSRVSGDSLRAVEADEIRALRYALRCALDESDRYAQQLREVKHEKRVLERQLKMAQSNLLLAEAQLSLMQEEASADRRAQDRRSEKSVATSVSPPTESTSSRTKRTSRAVPGLGDYIPETTSDIPDRVEVERERKATKPSAVDEAQTSVAKKPTEGVSISSLRKAARVQSGPSGDQRYIRKGRRGDDEEQEAKGATDDDDDDDLFDRPIRRPPPKQVSLNDFLESSRMTKEELNEYSANLESTATTSRASGMRSTSMSNMASPNEFGERKPAGFFRSFSSKTKGFELPLLPKKGLGGSLKTSQRGANSRLDMFLEQSIVPAHDTETIRAAPRGYVQNVSRNAVVPASELGHADERSRDRDYSTEEVMDLKASISRLESERRRNEELARRLEELEKRVESSVHGGGSIAPSQHERLSRWVGGVVASPTSPDFERSNYRASMSNHDLPRTYERVRGASRRDHAGRGRTPSLHSFVSVTEGSQLSLDRVASP